MKDNNALIILGMHRSGTSLLTGLLSQVGVKMGRRLYAPQKGVNEKGFWEHEDIVDTHDELLLHLGSQWDDLLPLDKEWWKADVVQPFVDRLTGLVRTGFFQRARLGSQRSPDVPATAFMVSHLCVPAGQSHFHLHESKSV